VTLASLAVAGLLAAGCRWGGTSACTLCQLQRARSTAGAGEQHGAHAMHVLRTAGHLPSKKNQLPTHSPLTCRSARATRRPSPAACWSVASSAIAWCLCARCTQPSLWTTPSSPSMTPGARARVCVRGGGRRLCVFMCTCMCVSMHIACTCVRVCVCALLRRAYALVVCPCPWPVFDQLTISVAFYSFLLNCLRSNGLTWA